MTNLKSLRNKIGLIFSYVAILGHFLPFFGFKLKNKKLPKRGQNSNQTIVPTLNVWKVSGLIVFVCCHFDVFWTFF